MWKTTWQERGQHDLRRGRRVEWGLVPDKNGGTAKGHYVLGIVFGSSYSNSKTEIYHFSPKSSR